MLLCYVIAIGFVFIEGSLARFEMRTMAVLNESCAQVFMCSSLSKIELD